MTIRRRYSFTEKSRVLAEQRRLGLSNAEICRRHSIQNNQLLAWRVAVENARFVSKTKKSLNTGRRSIYHEHETAIKDYILQRRSVSAIVNARSIIVKLVELCPNAAEKSFGSKQIWAYRFIARHKFSIRRITRNVRLPDHELQCRRISFLREIEQRHSQQQGTVFVNMDQVAVTYGDAGRVTIDLRGATSVQARTGATQVDRVTVALTIASTGEKLDPLIVFKGTQNGRVAREFTRTTNPYPSDLRYRTNQNAWMTEEVMLAWIESILVPFAMRHGPNEICVLLDSFSVHQNQQVRETLRNHLVDVIYIPGGLTCEMQPLDIGINRPFKHYIHEATINNANFEGLTASEKRLVMARSISFAFSSITTDSVINSFNRVLFTTLENIETAEEIEI